MCIATKEDFSLVRPDYTARLLRRAALLVLLLLWSLNAASQPGDERKKARKEGDRSQKQLVSEQRKGITRGQAASKVKQRYKSSRIMGISRTDGATPLYRVRILSREGVVKSVFVDGRTGEVFE
jgi:uncharacterized membrane protein YkoI